jgi:8-oxo-dGTP diphosphatase
VTSQASSYMCSAMSMAEDPKCLPHKHGVVAILQNSAGEYLFIRRGLNLTRAPGWWCFVGGEVESGESHDKAIVREVLEEVGLVVRPIDKVHESISPHGEDRLQWWRVELDGGAQIVAPHAHEVAEAKWLSADDGLRLEPILPGLKTWLEKIRNNPSR